MSTKSLDYTKTFFSRDPEILKQYTPGQWFCPAFYERKSVPKFQTTSVKGKDVIHIKRKGYTFVLGFGNPIQLITSNGFMIVDLPDFARNLETDLANKLAVKLWDKIVFYIDQFWLAFEEGSTVKMNAWYQLRIRAEKTLSKLSS